MLFAWQHLVAGELAARKIASADDLRQRFDADASASLDADEQQALLDYVQEHLAGWPYVEIGGRAVHWAVKSRQSRGLGDPLPSSYPIELRFTAEAAYDVGGPGLRLLIADTDLRFRQPVVCEIDPPAGRRLQHVDPAGLLVSRSPLIVEFRHPGDRLVLSFF